MPPEIRTVQIKFLVSMIS